MILQLAGARVYAVHVFALCVGTGELLLQEDCGVTTTPVRTFPGSTTTPAMATTRMTSNDRDLWRNLASRNSTTSSTSISSITAFTGGTVVTPSSPAGVEFTIALAIALVFVFGGVLAVLGEHFSIEIEEAKARDV